MGRELGNKALINEYLLGELGTKQPVSWISCVNCVYNCSNCYGY
ncbi:exported hypothetical protein [Carnobacterium divergens]|nr:exported hypothetical protein [Carnobacterium divergens]